MQKEIFGYARAVKTEERKKNALRAGQSKGILDSARESIRHTVLRVFLFFSFFFFFNHRIQTRKRAKTQYGGNCATKRREEKEGEKKKTLIHTIKEQQAYPLFAPPAFIASGGMSRLERQATMRRSGSRLRRRERGRGRGKWMMRSRMRKRGRRPGGQSVWQRLEVMHLQAIGGEAHLVASNEELRGRRGHGLAVGSWWLKVDS